MQSKPFLELSRISLRLNNRLVFRNTNWIFTADQNWALIGANGTGKTLLARAIAGELPIAGGEIRYGFRTPSDKVPEDFIAMVSFEQQKALAGGTPPAARWFSSEQEAAPLVRQFLSQDSVEDINPFEIRVRRPESTRLYARLMQRTIALLGIQPLLGRPLPSLSNGETRKVLLARALLKRPRLLILDDAFAGLDTRFRAHLKLILERLMASRTVRILLVASSLRDLPRGITHLLWIQNCRVAARGPRRAMMQDPRIRASVGDPTALSPRRPFPLKIRRRKDLPPPQLIQMKNVTARYDKRAILSGLSWTVFRGESWALVGPNGSGKSTLLSLIDGDNPQAYANSIYLFGRKRGSGESVWDLKKRIGWISPELHLHFPENQTCLETVLSGFEDSIGCHQASSSSRRRAAQKLLAAFGLSRLENLPFGSVSTGLQRMILLARALVKSPDLLLMDEPCQGLDLSHRERFLSMIEAILCHTQTTVIYVTHVPEEIPCNIRKVLRLKDGRAIRSGTMTSRRKTGRQPHPPE